MSDSLTETWGERFYRMAFMACALNSMFVWWFHILCFVVTMLLWLNFNPRPKPPNEKLKNAGPRTPDVRES